MLRSVDEAAIIARCLSLINGLLNLLNLFLSGVEEL